MATMRTWIVLEFEVEYDFTSGEDASSDSPGCNDNVDILSVKCVDPRITGDCTIEENAPTRKPELATEVAALFDGFEQECFSDVEKNYEDPRI